MCPLDVWKAASLSHHSHAALGGPYCDSRGAQQAYVPAYTEVWTDPLSSLLPHSGSTAWQNPPMTCGWAVVQTLVCVYGRKGRLKRGCAGSHWCAESDLEMKGEDMWVREGVLLASMVACVGRIRMWSFSLIDPGWTGEIVSISIILGRITDVMLLWNFYLWVTMGHTNSYSNVIFILDQSSNLRVSLLNLTIFVSDMGVVLPSCLRWSGWTAHTVLGTLSSLSNSINQCCLLDGNSSFSEENTSLEAKCSGN